MHSQGFRLVEPAGNDPQSLIRDTHLTPHSMTLHKQRLYISILEKCALCGAPHCSERSFTEFLPS